MASFTTTDPLDWLYNRLMFLLTDHAPLVSNFRSGNIIRYDQLKNHPQKDGEAVADFPQLTLQPTGVIPVQANSHETRVTMRYDLSLKTVSWKHQLITRVTWEAVIAILQWKGKINLDPWAGSSRPVVDNVFIPDIAVGQGTTLVGGESALINGWASLFQVEVRTHFITDEILP